MKRFAAITGKYSTCAVLCAHIIFCLLLSGFLRVDVRAGSEQEDATSSSISAGTLSQRAHALLSKKDSPADGLSTKPNRSRNSSTHTATALPEKLWLMRTAVRCLQLESSAPVAYSPLALSKPKGRAPPAAL